MSRSQKRKKRYKSLNKIVFIVTMTIILAINILLIDYRMNKILKEDIKYNLLEYIREVF